MTGQNKSTRKSFLAPLSIDFIVSIIFLNIVLTNAGVLQLFLSDTYRCRLSQRRWRRAPATQERRKTPSPSFRRPFFAWILRGSFRLVWCRGVVAIVTGVQQPVRLLSRNCGERIASLLPRANRSTKAAIVCPHTQARPRSRPYQNINHQKWRLRANRWSNLIFLFVTISLEHVVFTGEDETRFFSVPNVPRRLQTPTRPRFIASIVVCVVYPTTLVRDVKPQNQILREYYRQISFKTVQYLHTYLCLGLV